MKRPTRGDDGPRLYPQVRADHAVGTYSFNSLGSTDETIES